MKRECSVAGPVLVFAFLGWTLSAQTPPATDTAGYQNRCASCHGSTMTGGSAPSILAYIRYHTDAEVSAAIRERHSTMPEMSVPEPELRRVLADVRSLAGTNPAMATGGFTGRRGGGAGAVAATGGRGAAPRSASQGVGGAQPAPITLADGRQRDGVLLAQSEVSAVLLENGRFTLLARDGAVYREKAIVPKADWTHYDGSLTGNRYSPLELINPDNVQSVGAA